jgi:deoxyribodipyrimidine photolyase
VLGKDYPFPIVDHDVARKKALDKYAKIKKMNEIDSN